MADKVKVTTLPQMIRAAEYAKAYHDNFLVQMVGATPNCYRRAQLMSSDKTTITIYKNTQVNINDKGYVSTADVTLNLGDVLAAATRAGTDMYVYACEPSDAGTEPVFVVSANSTVPDGYDANNSRKIGGFHCLCADVGTISGHELSGYVAGDILPRSVWDLSFRANCENEGMVYIKEIGAWIDIYLASWNGEKLVSEYGATPVTGVTSRAMHGEKFAEEMGLAQKRLILREEFLVIAKGSNENTYINGRTNPGSTGGHVDTENRRMISNYGLEDCCGLLCQWSGDTFGVFNHIAGSTYSASIGQYGGADPDGGYTINGFEIDASTNPNGYSRSNNPDLDGEEQYGGWRGVLARYLLGSHYSASTIPGSRAVHLNCLSSCVLTAYGSRGAAGPRPDCAF